MSSAQEGCHLRGMRDPQSIQAAVAVVVILVLLLHVSPKNYAFTQTYVMVQDCAPLGCAIESPPHANGESSIGTCVATSFLQGAATH